MRHNKAYNWAYFKSNIEPTNAAKNFWNNDWNDFASNLRYSAANSFARGSRHSSRFSYRHTCRRKRIHGSRYDRPYFPTNN
jgi:hypothetical protein